MADGNGNTESTSAWYKVPCWDGSPLTWRAFRREMDWWVSSLDLEATKKYNLAARWLLRQQGPVRQRGEEFTPKDLEYQKELRGQGPDGEETILVPEDPLAGLNKLLEALEGINGRTKLDKRGELRAHFYQELNRKATERVSEFCSRFRTAVAELKSEGVDIPSRELGWFLKQKLGLDAIRMQLLDTALAGSEEYAVIEGEVLRLFKDLHLNDPLYRKVPPNRFFRGRGPSILSSASSSSGFSRLSSRASTGSFVSSRAPSKFSSAPTTRQVHMAETDVEEEQPDLIEQETGDAEEAAEGPSLQKVLQTEAEALATELEMAAQEGADDELLEGLESTVEAGAEALVSMREARSRLQQVRKDRGYKGPSANTSTSTGPKAAPKRGLGPSALRKQSGKHPCYDCGQHGHWAGDPECPKPGQGLFRKPPSSVPKERPPQRQVRVAEHMNEVQAIESRTKSRGRRWQCNRTCAGAAWLKGYLKALEGAPQLIKDLVKSVPESESFRFGNGGVTPSYERWRLPAVLNNVLFMFWVSIVPVTSLGLLLGRDCLEALGAVIDFEAKLLHCRKLFQGTVRLEQMKAGHFMVSLLPLDCESGWGLPLKGRFRKFGLDGVVEVVNGFPDCSQLQHPLPPPLFRLRLLLHVLQSRLQLILIQRKTT